MKIKQPAGKPAQNVTLERCRNRCGLSFRSQWKLELYTPTSTRSVPTKNAGETIKHWDSFSATKDKKAAYNLTERPNALPASWRCPGQRGRRDQDRGTAAGPGDANPCGCRLHRRGETTGDRGVETEAGLADRGQTQCDPGTGQRRARRAKKPRPRRGAFVEHPFHIVKNLFGHRKARYRGLAKNGHELSKSKLYLASPWL